MTRERVLTLGLLTIKEIPQSLAAFRGIVDDSVITLTYSDVLPDADSARLLQINNALKDLYFNYLEGKRALRDFFDTINKLGSGPIDLVDVA